MIPRYWRKLCIHLSSLTVRHFVTVGAMKLKKKYGVEVTFNGMTSILNCIKIKLVKTLLRTSSHMHRQNGDLISLTFLFKEGRLKMLFGI